MKKILIIIISALMIFFFSITVLAQEDFLENSLDSVLSGIDDDTKALLEEFGLSNYSYEELYSISVSDIADLIFSIFKGCLKEPLECAIAVVSVSLICSAGSLCINKNNGITQYFEMISVIFISLLIFLKVTACISRTVTSVESLGVLMKLLVPVLAVLASVSGSPTLAISYNAMTVYIAEIITAVCRDFLTPLLITFSCVSVCLSVNSVIKSDSVLNMLKKCINMLLGLAGTIFTGVITMKDILAVGADKVSVKGIKFLIGSSVPVVGNALSEGLSSIIASVSLMKSTVGIIGVIIIIVIVLPVVCELLVWNFSLSFAGYCCEIFLQNKASSLLSSFRFTVSMLLSVLLFTTYILIVSTGMIILMGNK